MKMSMHENVMILVLVLRPKQRAWKGEGWECKLGITFTFFRIVEKCEGMSPHILKWAPTLRVEVPKDFKIFKEWFEGSKFIGLKSLLCHWIFLKRRCLKWTCMIHLSIYNTSYGRNKNQKSKCQFDLWPLKVRNRP
jgi:hypothetical protein